MIKKSIGILALVLCISLINVRTARPQDKHESRQPNILVIFSDQHSAWAMSSAGADFIQTPHLDRLADDGVMFTNAYTTNPVCMPARVSMMTGRMPSELGMNYNGAVDSFFVSPALGEHLKNAGYETAWIGKSHLRPTADRGLDTFMVFNHDDARSTRESLEFIKQDRERPFFLLTNYHRSHDISQYARKIGNNPDEIIPQGELERIPHEDYLPPLPDNFEIPAHEPTAIREIVVPAHLSIYTLVNADERAWREYLWAYGRLVEQMDEHIGALLDGLREENLYDDMLIIYLSDHGEGSAAHRWNQKQILYEASVNVPFIVKPPGGSGIASRIDRVNVVSAILDLMPTVSDYAEAGIPEELHGRSVRPLVEDPESEAVHLFVVAETTFGSFSDGNHGVSGRMLRTPQYKYIVYDKGDYREQLFDMLDDPGETLNLAVRPEYRQVLHEYRKILRQWILETHDFFDGVPIESDKP